MRKDTQTKLDKEQLRNLIHVNLDARQYFYANANERWLDWLWENGFLDVVKEKAEDPTSYGYRIPELEYLVRMAKMAPAKVVKILLAVPISSETFNPEVIDRFSYICSTLPEDQLAHVVQKIRDERWIPLMGAFEHWGSNCEDMFKTLDDAKDYESLLVLAEAVLSVRIKDEPKKAHSESLADTPFYFNYLSYVKVFEYLLNVDDEYTEQALDLATKIMANVIASEWSKKSVFGQLQRSAEEYVGIAREVERVFAVGDYSLLHNVDLFDPGSLSSSDHDVQDDVRELAAVITMLARKLIGDRCDKPEAIRDVYKKYFGDFDNPDAKLPDSQAMWRLRLFVLSLCPEVFRDELKKALFRLFEVEQYHEIIAGTEYKKALQKGFIALSEEDNRDYVKRVVEYFTRPDRVKETGEKDVHMHDGSQILSMIADLLTEDEKSLAQERGLTLDPGHQPVPLIDEAQGGWISSRGPMTQEKIRKTLHRRDNRETPS